MFFGYIPPSPFPEVSGPASPPSREWAEGFERE
jgi:hypothetical protein